MCGIAGIFGIYDEAAVRRMTEAMAHRGPDDTGVWGDPTLAVTLGHRRLSIIDLTAAGHQPMSYRDGRLWITFNGEIYNYRELRAELEVKGHVFRSHTDTETILAAYAEWGPSCVSRLTGMFAFALVDLRPPADGPSIFLARDRLGIKPLLYAEQQGALVFASEMRALFASEIIPRITDTEGLRDFFLFGCTFQPRTIIAGVYALLPGHCLEIRNGQRRVWQYWDLHESSAGMRERFRDADERDILEQLDVEMTAATRRHMIADVPVGAFLSGGLDSSLVTALMSRISGQRISTFSVGFERKHASLDERHFARLAAKHIGCDHHEELVRDEDIDSIFEAAIASMDRPSVDGINSWIIGRAASRFVKVVLSGLGGDEIFAGYTHFKIIRDAEAKNAGGHALEYKFWSLLRRHTPIGPWGFSRLICSASSEYRLPLFRLFPDAAEMAGAFTEEFNQVTLNRAAQIYSSFCRPDADPIQQVTYGEVRGYLLNMLLRDTDCMSMAHSLEVRPVLIDHPLAEFAYALPGRMKVNGSTLKAILKRFAVNLLPSEIINRPKMGFSLPFSSWLQESERLRARFAAAMEFPTARRIFSPKYRAQINRLLRTNSPAPVAVWGWVILISWIENKLCVIP